MCCILRALENETPQTVVHHKDAEIEACHEKYLELIRDIYCLTFIRKLGQILECFICPIIIVDACMGVRIIPGVDREPSGGAAEENHYEDSSSLGWIL